MTGNRTEDPGRPIGCADVNTLVAARRDAFDHAMLTMVVVMVIGAIAHAYASSYSHSWSDTWVIVYGLGAIALIAALRRLPWRVRGAAAMVTFVCVCSRGVLQGGFHAPNAFTGIALMLLFAMLIFGGWAALASGLVFIAACVVSAVSFMQGKELDNPAFYDLATPYNWGRVLMTFVAICGGATAMVGLMLRRLHRELQRNSDLFREVAAQNEARLEALNQQSRLTEQLQRAQKFEALGRLAGGVAHDFNNLLVVILNNAQWIQHADPGEARQAARDIEQAGERASGLTRKLLTFGRQKATQGKVMDFDTAVESALEVIRHMLPNSVHLDFVPGRAGTVRALQTEIHQLLQNLCLNARDAMPAGGTIVVRTKREQGQNEKGQPTDFAVLQVADQGHGIAAHLIDRLFEPFFTTKEGSGTGLGLSIVHGIVTQLGGSIGVTSKPGLGTTFTIQIPHAELEAETAAPKPTAASRAPERARIVVLDTDEEVRRVLVRSLREAGHEMIEFATAESALRELEKSNATVDMLVTDTELSGASGIDVYRRIAEHRPDLRVLFCSTAFAANIEPRFLADSRRAHLGKPFHSEELVRAVHELLAAQTVS